MKFIFVSDFSKKLGGGFRDCLILDLNFPVGDSRRETSFIGREQSVRTMAEAFGAKVFLPGEWEAKEAANWLCHKCGKMWFCAGMHSDCDGESSDMEKFFPPISPALLEEIGATESEAAI